MQQAKLNICLYCCMLYFFNLQIIFNLKYGSSIPNTDATIASNDAMVALTEAVTIAPIRDAIIAPIKQLEI